MVQTAIACMACSMAAVTTSDHLPGRMDGVGDDEEVSGWDDEEAVMPGGKTALARPGVRACRRRVGRRAEVTWVVNEPCGRNGEGATKADMSETVVENWS